MNIHPSLFDITPSDVEIDLDVIDHFAPVGDYRPFVEDGLGLRALLEEPEPFLVESWRSERSKKAGRKHANRRRGRSRRA